MVGGPGSLDEESLEFGGDFRFEPEAVGGFGRILVGVGEKPLLAGGVEFRAVAILDCLQMGRGSASADRVRSQRSSMFMNISRPAFRD